MPAIDGYSFGRVTIDGREETRDVIVLPERVVRGWWRKEGHGLVLEDLDEVLDEREEPEEINPPTAAHLESVFRLLPPKLRLAFLFLDWSGARVSAVDLTLVSDYDEPRCRVRLRATTTKTRRALWIDLHPRSPRRSSNNSAHGRIATRTPVSSRGRAPMRYALRSRRLAVPPAYDSSRRMTSAIGGSASSICGAPRARIGEFVGQRNLSVTADVYSHVLGDETELDYAGLTQSARS